jgi:hypothetical protein
VYFGCRFTQIGSTRNPGAKASERRGNLLTAVALTTEYGASHIPVLIFNKECQRGVTCGVELLLVLMVEH